MFVLMAMILFPSTSGAQSELETIRARISRLEEKEARREGVPSPSEEEIARLKMGIALPEDLQGSFTGLAPGASKVYFSRTPLSIGGYAEVHSTSEERGPRSTNLARVNPYLGYRFSRNIVFNSGFTFQNGGAIDGVGAAAVEFAYLDFLFAEESGIRAGQFLVPFGLRNLRSEPTLFPMVNRQETELNIVPTTWHENGVMGFWKTGKLLLQGGISSTVDASRFETATWIRAGRQEGGGGAIKAEDAALFIRAEAIDRENTIGISVYTSKTSQGDASLGDARLLLGAVHGEIGVGRFAGQAMYAEGSLSDTDKIAATTEQVLGRRARGGYLILSYDLLPNLVPVTRLPNGNLVSAAWQQLPLFASYEYQDLNAEVPAGFSRDDALRTQTYTVGLNFKPHPQVVIKADYANEVDGAGGDKRVFETAIGAVF